MNIIITIFVITAGDLLYYRNKAVADLGHGRLSTTSADYLDSWQPPDSIDFVEKEYGQWRHRVCHHP